MSNQQELTNILNQFLNGSSSDQQSSTNNSSTGPLFPTGDNPLFPTNNNLTTTLANAMLGGNMFAFMQPSNTGLPMGSSRVMGPRLLHRQCTICQQYETAVRDYIIAHAQLAENSTLNCEDVDALHAATHEMWLEHHVEDAIRHFALRRERRRRLEEFIQNSMENDAPKPEQATDDMISTLDTNKQEANSNDSCVICLTTFETDDMVTKTKCNHQFHQECISTWLKTNISCPICRCNAITGKTKEEQPETD